MIVRPDEFSPRDFYRILVNAVAPRPIAWVSTISASGHQNLAPFSFFNVVCADPPLLGISTALRQGESGHEPKDTLHNIRETREFVINVVTYDLAEPMNLTGGEYHASVDEFEIAQLATAPSSIVRPPRVARSPINFECKLHTILDFGTDEAPGGSFIVGEIVSVHIEDTVMKQGKIDSAALDLIGRMGGSDYCRTAERFALERPRVK
jgi:flavin reductase (DIM6/NTAB) family NADH-FMN oxidoreductase RutF